MARAVPILSVLLLIVAAAGCATNDKDTPPTTTTPKTSTPATTTPSTTTPTATPTPTPPTIVTPEPEPLDCPNPATTTSAAADLMGFPQIVFTTTEGDSTDPCFSFVGPASVSAGWTAVTLQNTGMQPHIMPMFRLVGEHTRAEIIGALMAGAPPEWAVPVGGVGFATPFSSGSVIMDLQEGEYVVACFFNGHHAQGMWRTLNVTAAEGNVTAAPTTNMTIELNDFSFTVPNLTAGLQIVAVHNNGTQPHEAPLVKLNANTTMQQFLAAVESAGPTSPPPPGAGVGGVNILAPGATSYAIVDLIAGTDYGMVCFVEDPASEAPHVALGMATQFHVA